MTIISTPEPTPSRSLFKATVVAALVAAGLLVTIVLPAEYGIDPTGVGGKLGLTTLAAIDDSIPAPVDTAASEPVGDRNAAEATKAAAAFGASANQSFSTESLANASVAQAPKQESLVVTLAPGKGAEVKTLLKADDGIVYRWSADGDVAVDMHGERPGVKGAWTSYAVEPAQREHAGTFVAPFEGSHGWYWENRGTTPVTVRVEISGFQSALYQP